MPSVGSDPLICTGMAPANLAVGGACLAAAFFYNVDIFYFVQYDFKINLINLFLLKYIK